MWNWWVSLDQPFSEMELVTTSKIERLSLLFSIFLLISILPHATIPPPLPETSANSKFNNSVYKRTCIYLNTTIQIARWPNPLNFSLGKKGFSGTGPDRITLIRVFQTKGRSDTEDMICIAEFSGAHDYVEGPYTEYQWLQHHQGLVRC